MELAVPFYFAARSPMLYVIYKGDVPSYDGGQDGLVYLVADIAGVRAANLPFVFTDRNAATSYARFSDRADELDRFVDWELMEDRWWHDSPEDPDRMNRRMAEFLVHERVPWKVFIGLAARSNEDAATARDCLAKVNIDVSVLVRPGWYY